MTVAQSTEKGEIISPVVARLRQAQEALGLNASSLADAIGVSRSYVSLLFSGEKRVLSPATVTRAAAALAINKHWLLTGTGEMRVVAQETPDPAREPLAGWRADGGNDAAAALQIMDDAHISEYIRRGVDNPGSMPAAAFAAFAREWERRARQEGKFKYPTQEK